MTTTGDGVPVQFPRRLAGRAPAATVRPVLVVALVLTALVLGAAVTWWVLHPVVFAPVGITVGYENARVGEAVYFGLDAMPQEEVQITRVVPVGIAPETADVEVVVCDGGVVGTAKSLTGVCDAVRPAAGSRMAPGSDAELVAKVVPLVEGAFEIRYEAQYRVGLRSGRDIAGKTTRYVTAGEEIPEDW